MLADANPNEDIQTLVDLGLTYRESKIFLTLSLLGRATINNLSSAAKMDRANVYRVVNQLRELKIVQVLITNPKTFEALPLNDPVQLLLDGKKKKYKNAEYKAQKFLRRYKQNRRAPANSKESQLILIPGGKLTLRKIEELVNSTKETHEGILYLRDIRERIDFFHALFKKLIFNNVKIRLLVSCENKEGMDEIFESLQNKNLEIRINDAKPQDTFSIWDKKSVFLTIKPKISEPMTDGLFINNFAIVGLIQEYFELKWAISKTIQL